MMCQKLSSMVEDWISRANARQRRGRAGRVKPGICFCMYTRHRFEKLMRPFQVSILWLYVGTSHRQVGSRVKTGSAKGMG